MVRPIIERRPLSGKVRQPPGQKVFKGGAGNVDVAAGAIDEIHGDVERIVRIALKTHARFKGERQHARAFPIRVAPDLATQRFEAVGPSFGEWRGGKQRRHDRLQSKRNAQFFDHVGFIGKVDVHLNSGGPIHHVETARSHLRHETGHNRVAILGHARRFCERPLGRKTKPQKPDTQRLANAEDLAEVLPGLPARFVQRSQRGAR